MALQVFRQLLSILCFFRKGKVVYSDLKPQNLLPRELPGGRFEVQLNDFGFVGAVGGEFQGGTGEYMHPDYLQAKILGASRPKYPPLDYILDTWAALRILFEICGLCGRELVDVELVSEAVKDVSELNERKMVQEVFDSLSWLL